MTTKEYLMAQLSKFGLTSEDIDILILDSGLNGNEPVNGKPDTIVIKKGIFTNLPGMIAGLADITEGGYSRKWNYAALKAWISILAGELGLDDPFAEKIANIRGRSPW